MRFARSREKIFFSLHFASNFSLPTKAKSIHRFFALFRFEAKRTKHFFDLFTSLGIDLKNWKTGLNIFLRFFTDCHRISLYPFWFWSIRFFFVFSLHFIFKHFFRIEAKKFRFRFASFRFKAKMTAVYFFFVSFSLCFIFVSLQISTFRIDAKQAKKSLFLHRSEKKFRFRFASFRFDENDGAPCSPYTLVPYAGTVLRTPAHLIYIYFSDISQHFVHTLDTTMFRFINEFMLFLTCIIPIVSFILNISKWCFSSHLHWHGFTLVNPGITFHTYHVVVSHLYILIVTEVSPWVLFHLGPDYGWGLTLILIMEWRFNQLLIIAWFSCPCDYSVRTHLILIKEWRLTLVLIIAWCPTLVSIQQCGITMILSLCTDSLWYQLFHSWLTLNLIRTCWLTLMHMEDDLLTLTSWRAAVVAAGVFLRCWFHLC